MELFCSLMSSQAIERILLLNAMVARNGIIELILSIRTDDVVPTTKVALLLLLSKSGNLTPGDR